MHTIIEDIKRKSATDDPIGDRVWEDQMSQFGEGGFENEEQSRGHDQSKSIHG